MYKHLLLFSLSLNCYADVFEEVSKKYNIPEGLVKAVCTVESNLRHNVINIHDGHGTSFGLCQVKRITAKHMLKRDVASELFTTSFNINVAAQYLHYQYKRYGNWDAAVIAFNRGHYKKGYEKNNVYLKKVKLSWKKLNMVK